MQALTNHSTMPATEIAVWYLDSFEDGFGLPDGHGVRFWQAYDVLSDLPIGPRGGDVNPAYVRLWMEEHRPGAVECEIVQVTA
jgi:hypothetical protein